MSSPLASSHIRLTSLDELDCSFNEIEALPSSVGQCVNIRTFAADHNFLTQLPPEVSVRISAYMCVCSKSIDWHSMPACSSVTASVALNPGFFPLTAGQLEECNCAVSTFQQAGVFAWGDGWHAEAQGHQSQQQQVSLDWQCDSESSVGARSNSVFFCFGLLLSKRHFWAVPYFTLL